MAKTENLKDASNSTPDKVNNDRKREPGQVDKITDLYNNNAFKRQKLENKETDSYDQQKQKLDPSQSQQKHSTQPQMPGDTENIVVYHAHISGDEMKRCQTCHGHLKDCCRRSIFAAAQDLPRESGNESRQIIHRHSFDVIVVKRLSKL